MNQEQTKFTKLDFESWREKASRLGILSKRAKQIARQLGVEVRDNWYNVSDLRTVDGSPVFEEKDFVNGSPWIEEKDFLEIIKNSLDE